jgi:hypothetical protein
METAEAIPAQLIGGAEKTNGSEHLVVRAALECIGQCAVIRLSLVLPATGGEFNSEVHHPQR